MRKTLNQSGWAGFPSGSEKPVMEIKLSKLEFEHLYGLEFLSGEDSLGRGDSTYFNDELLGTVTILLYENSRNGMAFVYVDSALSLRVAVPRLLAVFDLDPTLVNVPRDLG